MEDQLEVNGPPAEEDGIDERQQEEISPVSATLGQEVAQIHERMTALEESIDELKQGLQSLVDWLEIIPRSLRQVNHKIESMTESINEPRVKNLLNELLIFHDLLEQSIRTASPGSPEAQNYKMLLTQVTQILSLNGLQAIPDQVQFDPQLHKALQIIPCNSPDEDGQIAEVYRRGFRTAHAVLRYCDVVVKRYEPLEAKEEE